SQDIVTEAAGGGLDIVFASASFVLGFEVDNLTLTGNGDFNATGNALANILIGNGGNNILNGNAGADRMSGGMGDDSYTVDNIGDTASEAAGGGTDSVVSSVSFTLGANVENLTLTGLGAIGGTGNILSNVIIGNSGANTLIGGEGDDDLDGQGGSDRLDGGA